MLRSFRQCIMYRVAHEMILDWKLKFKIYFLGFICKATLTASIFCGLRIRAPRPQLFSRTVPSCSNYCIVRIDNGKWPTAYHDEREIVSAFPLQFRQKQHGLWCLLHLKPSSVRLPSLVHWRENTRYFSGFSTRHMCHLTHLHDLLHPHK
jgi:hypothetical protein